MVQSFQEFRKLREAADGTPDSGKDEAHKDLHSNITLGDGNDFPPFVVSDRKGNKEHGGQNANLAPIIRAFKDGATWGATKEKDTGGLKDVKISGAKLYLVGGSVRDIIMGRTPKDFDITTNATPEEIEKILEQNGFTKRDGPPSEADEHSDQKQLHGYDGPSPQDAHNKSFFHLGKDERGQPFVYGVVVNGEMYELATFRKDHKGGDNIKLNQVQHGTHADDAKRRDLTMNQMYIQLDNPDGENKKLIDHHGGIHDIKAGRVKFVGDAKDRLEEDPIRALRAIRFAHRFGKGSASVDAEDKKEIHNIIDAIKERVAPERIQAELKKGMGYKDVDPTKYLKSLEEFGLLDIAFPGLNKNTEFPDDMQEFHGSPHHMLAHMLKGNQDLGELSKSLNNLKYSNDDSDKIGHLIKMLRFNSDNVDPDELEQLMKSHLQSGLPNKATSSWMTKVGGKKPHEADALFQHFGAPRVKVTHGDGSGPFDDLINPITGNPIPATANLIGGRKRGMEYGNFHTLLQGLAPKKEA